MLQYQDIIVDIAIRGCIAIQRDWWMHLFACRCRDEPGIAGTQFLRPLRCTSFGVTSANGCRKRVPCWTLYLPSALLPRMPGIYTSGQSSYLVAIPSQPGDSTGHFSVCVPLLIEQEKSSRADGRANKRALAKGGTLALAKTKWGKMGGEKPVRKRKLSYPIPYAGS